MEKMCISRISDLESARSSLRERTFIACSKTDKTSSPMCIACTEKLHHKEIEVEQWEFILMEVYNGLITENLLNSQGVSWIRNVDIHYLWFTWLTKGRSYCRSFLTLVL